MLFFADVSIFARRTFKTRRNHFSDINFFEFSYFWLHFPNFEGSEWVLIFSVPDSKIRAKKT